jgi:hypothetical protein
MRAMAAPSADIADACGVKVIETADAATTANKVNFICFLLDDLRVSEHHRPAQRRPPCDSNYLIARRQYGFRRMVNAWLSTAPRAGGLPAIAELHRRGLQAQRPNYRLRFVQEDFPSAGGRPEVTGKKFGISAAATPIFEPNHCDRSTAD